MSGNFGDPAEVLTRRSAFCSDHGIDHARIAFIEACHTGSVALIKKGRERQAFMKPPSISADFPSYLTAIDGLLSLDPDVPVALLSADCVPLVVVDEVMGLHGILHVGLLGLLNDIVGTAAVVLASLSVPVARVRFHLGTHIGAASYDLSKSGMWERVGTEAQEKCPWIGEFITSEGFLDLGRAVESRLIAIGAVAEHISHDGRDTAGAGDEFFSHYKAQRKLAENGRFMTLIG
jgi:polyphenol oxidase